MRRAKQKEMLRKEFRNKYPGKVKNNTGGSFPAVSHQFYYHKTHGNLVAHRCENEALVF